MRRLVIGLVGIGSLVAVLAGQAVAQSSKPDATLIFSSGSVAAGIGFSWGNGTLSYNGKTYPVRVEGLSVGAAGVTRATAKANVFNLAKVEDFSGNYAAVSAGATVGGGGGADPDPPAVTPSRESPLLKPNHVPPSYARFCL